MRYLGDGAEGLAARALQKPCIICGQEATVAAAYQASGANAERLGAKPGKTRIVFYSLCDAHPWTWRRPRGRKACSRHCSR